MSNQTSNNNKRIAKNTFFLYIRMFLMMAINLYTSRVVLATLGVSDYGIYNVVGGVVGMFGLLSGSITNSITRFLTFELGKKNKQQLQNVFSTSLNVMIILSIVIFIIGEVFGSWFLNCKMNIPEERTNAANWVFQCSLLTFIIYLISIPYNSTIVANEKMSAFAYISIFEVSMKLLVVYTLSLSPYDKLKSYAILLLILSLLIRMIYGFYCKKKFKEATYHFVNDKELLKKMVGFAGWNFFAQGANLISTQGIDIIINIFFGVTVNAARGIANQVNTAVNQFVTNFMMSLNPQITKSYASGNFLEMHKLICRGAKFSYFLMLFFIIPICLETKIILQIWLNNVPNYAVDFVRCALILTSIGLLSNTLVTGLHATGKIKRYMIIVGLIEFAIFPLTYLSFKCGLGPLVTYYISIAVYLILMFLRLFLIKDLIHMKMNFFVMEVYFKIAMVTFTALIVPIFICFVQTDSLVRLFEISILGTLSIVLSVYYVGLSFNERTKIMNYIKNRF